MSDASIDQIRVRLVIHGEVQGVWFRESTREQAERLGVTGWVRNRPEGTVEAVIEGPREAVESLARWCHQGPPSARVTKVDRADVPGTGEFDRFEVRR